MTPDSAIVPTCSSGRGDTDRYDDNKRSKVDDRISGAASDYVASGMHSPSSSRTLVFANTLERDRYVVFEEIASGGMASVHLGMRTGDGGFKRIVAIKRLHGRFAGNREFTTVLLDEARLAARIRHVNVVPVIDIVERGGAFLLVMEYVHGQSLAQLWRVTRARRTHIAPAVIAAIMSGVCRGVHAAHEVCGRDGKPLHIVHRDISPQNILVGCDGLARVIDFGVAKAAERLQTTRTGVIKGKVSYMPPEQLMGTGVTRRTDVYAIGVVLWELLTGQRAFVRSDEAGLMKAILEEPLPRPSAVSKHVPPAFDAVVMRALARNPYDRYASARHLGLDLEATSGMSTMTEVGTWVRSCAGEALDWRAGRISRLENGTYSESEAATSWRVHEAAPIPPTARKPYRIGRTSARGLLGATRRIVRRLIRAKRDRRLLVVGASLVILAGVILLWTSPRDMQSVVDPMAPVTRFEPLVIATWPTRLAEGPLEPTARIVTKGSAAVHGMPATVWARSECQPAFVIDERGHKRYKAACLD